MYSTLKRLCSLLLFISVIHIVISFYWPTWAQSVEPNSQKDQSAASIEKKANTESPSESPADQISKKPDKIDQVGEKVGQQIDDITQRASSRIGPWINSEVFSGITWFKLILCLFLLFVVLFIERIVRLAIDRKEKKAEEEEAKKNKTLCLRSRCQAIVIVYMGLRDIHCSNPFVCAFSKT